VRVGHGKSTEENSLGDRQILELSKIRIRRTVGISILAGPSLEKTFSDIFQKVSARALLFRRVHLF
jgi:hypothetical protein